ncbi:MAG TPA: sigma 54-interacting transcriptional regulator [Polyangiaceae bacterium]
MKAESSAPRASATTQTAETSMCPGGDGNSLRSLLVVHTQSVEQVGIEIPLRTDLLVVGRDVANGLRIDDPQLSRVHFRVVYDQRSGTHRLGDAQSRNGTFVGGARVGSCSLSPGSVVRAGETVFLYDEPDRMAKVRALVPMAAATDRTVLLLGQTGTGKELLAREIHRESQRPGEFVPINCATLSRDLLGSELFGHARGAFSGAARAHIGLFQAAHRGTLFLDEIGDLPLDLQAMLLRAVQERSIRPLGTNLEVPVDVRIVAATHVDLEAVAREGRFRGDLFARLSQIVVRVPALRDRRREILPLARRFAEALNREFSLTASAAEILMRWDYPYNVRELESVIGNFVSFLPRRALDKSYFESHHPELLSGFRVGEQPASGKAQGNAASRMNRDLLVELLSRHGGNVSAAAAELGKPRAQVYRWLRSFGLNAERYR